MKREKRKFPQEEKLIILQEAKENGVTETCRKYGIYDSLYYYWKEKFDRGGEEELKPQYVKRNEKEMSKLQKENYRLKQILAEKELEVQMQAELIKKKMQLWKSERK
jgi:putative transposase